MKVDKKVVHFNILDGVEKDRRTVSKIYLKILDLNIRTNVRDFKIIFLLIKAVEGVKGVQIFEVVFVLF